jgi:hypothetical protein
VLIIERSFSQAARNLLGVFKFFLQELQEFFQSFKSLGKKEMLRIKKKEILGYFLRFSEIFRTFQEFVEILGIFKNVQEFLGIFLGNTLENKSNTSEYPIFP